jgi:hypothetical protein
MLTSVLVGLSLILGQAEPANRTSRSVPSEIVGARLLPPNHAEEQEPPNANKTVPTVPALIAPEPSGNLQRLPPGAPILYFGQDAHEENKESKDKNDADKDNQKEAQEPLGFFGTLWRAYRNEFFPKNTSKNGNGDEEQKPEYRRGLPAPWEAPPFPSTEYQGYPLIGVPPSTTNYPFMQAVYATPWGDAIKDTRIKFDGWAAASGNWSTSRQSNVPSSYWIVPNRYELDQVLFRLQREVDTVQTDHIDWGFRSVTFYGMDYRYTTAGGWFSRQLLANNSLYGWDPAEQYFDLYIPFIGEGAVLRVGRWIACPDIETQWAPDNYLGSHSLLFTVDTYTQTGIMWTQRLSDQWLVQAAIHSGTDMAPWYPGAIPTGAFGVRWVSKDNNDAFYGWLNAINNAEFRHFQQYGQALGHDNFNYAVGTWEHRFSKEFITKTEAYFMWERDAELGGTPSAGPIEPYGGGGGDGTLIPGWSRSYGILNYTMLAMSKKDYITVRNEWYRDETGYRLGVAGNYTSHTIGISHYFNDVFIVRPEIGYYRNWNNPAFDNGTKRDMVMYGFDMILRF